MAVHRPISDRPTGKSPGTPDGQSTPALHLGPDKRFIKLSPMGETGRGGREMH